MRSVCDCMQCKGNSSVLRALYILGHKFGAIRGPFAYVWCDAGEGVGGYYIHIFYLYVYKKIITVKIVKNLQLRVIYLYIYIDIYIYNYYNQK